MRYFISVLLILSLSMQSFAQQLFVGRVHKTGTNEVIMSVSIENLTRTRYNLSDQGGNFKIAASAGDTVIFSSAGYRSDTLVVTASMLSGGYEMYMEPRVVALPTVRVGGLSNYQLDSAERRLDYAWVYDYKPAKTIDRNRQGDGVGVNLNIPSFSSNDRQRKELKKRLLKEEENYYIDSRFTREYVSRLTRLQGDSLQQFMVQYRPSYSFCRRATNQDILLWINDSLKKYMKISN